jgi:hypothetical protein
LKYRSLRRATNSALAVYAAINGRAFPYTLTFNVETVRVEPMTVIEGVASGELEGRGVWNISEEGDDTVARYDWRVSTSKPWMKTLAPIAKPVFKWNHDEIMGWGAQGLSKRLNARIFEGK